MIFGMVLVLLGAVLLLNNLGITTISIGDIVETYWPVVLVALGLAAVLKPRGDEPIRDERTHYDRADDEPTGPPDQGGLRNEEAEAVGPSDIGEAREPCRSSGPNIGGWILIGLGVLMLAANTRFWGFDFGRLWGTFWALVVILVGWTVLRSSPPAGQVGHTQWVVMSGLEQRATGWPLRSGSYVVVMGGADLDLRVADVPEGETYLDLTAIMGAIELIVPPDMSVECEGAAILGGVTVLGQSSGGVISSRTFTRAGSAGSSKKLRVRCRAIMGGVEFK